MKGLVLAGGSGTRLRPITFSMAKQLIPVANKPIIEFGLEDLAEAGLTTVGVIVSPETGAAIREAITPVAGRLGLDITFIVQDAPLGLAHALRTALPFIDGDECLMYLGDNLVKGGVADIVRDFATRRPNCQIMLSRVDNPSAFGVAELSADGTVKRLVEKPADPPSDLALVGVYLFDGSIAEAVTAIEPSDRGEYEITDAIQYLIDAGRRVDSSIVSGWWKDTGTRVDLLNAQRLVIDDLAHGVAGELAGTTAIEGRVAVGRRSRLVDCTVRGPAVIGTDVSLSNTLIGPYTAIGDRCEVTDTLLENSIVMSDSRVVGWRLSSSIVGRRVVLGPGGPPEPVEVMLGDRSQILVG